MYGRRPGFSLEKILSHFLDFLILKNLNFYAILSVTWSLIRPSRFSIKFINMDENDLKGIKDKLLERKEKLEAKLAKISTSGEKGAEATYEDIEDDEDVNAQEVSQFSDRLSLVAQLSKNLDDVNKSLKKVDEGGYGVCKYCKKDINPKRLIARPSSGACISCKAILQGEQR